MAESRRWVVTAAPGAPLSEVARALTDAGFAIQDQMDAIGVVMGDADDAVAERLRGVQGVADVSPDTPIDIGPPGETETW